MGRIRTNKQYIVPGALISASYVSDLYDLVTGNIYETTALSGSLAVTGSIYGTLVGTASWAQSSSYAALAATASYFSGSITNTISASYALTASYALNGGGGNLDTSSLITTAQTASMTVLSASYAANAIATFPYTGSAGISGSLLVNGQAAFGFGSVAPGTGSFANGFRVGATGSYSHAEGGQTQAIGNFSHAEGQFNQASGIGSHAEGAFSVAYGNYSHTEGYYSQTYGQYGHAEGKGTVALDEYQHVSGKYNLPMSGSGATIIGNGNEFEPRNLLVAIDTTVQVTGSLRVSGSVFVDLLSLPTADPQQPGQIWRSGNFIMVSLG